MTAEELAAMERRARMFEAASEKILAEKERLREENARLRETQPPLFVMEGRVRGIVERLREQGKWRNDKAWDSCPIAEEAADEITRLREENARLETSVGEIMQVRDQRENRLREENARLVDILDDVLAQWDGDWPEELYARVKAAIREAGKEG